MNELAFRPTTTVTIFRDDPEEPLLDEYGDELANNSTDSVSGGVAATGVPISIWDKTVRQYRPDENRTTTITTTTGRVRASAGVEPLDRLKDESTGRIYFVEEVERPGSALGSTLVRLVLTKVGASP